MAADGRVEIGPRPVPQEPMYIIANLGISPSFGDIDFDHLTFPTKMTVDWIRVYQDPDAINYGCDPKDFPTAEYIKTCVVCFGLSIGVDLLTSSCFCLSLDTRRRTLTRTSLHGATTTTSHSPRTASLGSASHTLHPIFIISSASRPCFANTALNSFCFALSTLNLCSTMSEYRVFAVQHQLYRRSFSAPTLSLQHRLARFLSCVLEGVSCVLRYRRKGFTLASLVLCVLGSNLWVLGHDWSD